MRIASGDEIAFYDFYKIYRPQLRRFAIDFTHSEIDADDILQETFMRVWLNRDKITAVDNPRAWLFTVNARVCLVWLRRKLHHQKKIEQLTPLDSLLETPFDSTNINQLRELIQQAVEAMPEQRRRIFRMSRDEGRKPAEIAELLGLSGGTVRNVLMIALKDIRESLAKAGYRLDLFLFLCLLGYLL